jgi:glycerophosphoryl diester phosphodiesterase
MARVLIKSAGGQPQVIELKLGPNRLGRSDDNDIQIDHPTVSGNHCEIVLGDRSIKVRDLSSTNGTFINGQPIQESELHAGQTLRLGSVELEMESEEVRIAIPPIEVPPVPGPSFLADGRAACLNHADLPATQRCTHCGLFLCAACVHEIHRLGGASLKLCPACSGACEPLVQAPGAGPRRGAGKKKSLLGRLRETLRLPLKRRHLLWLLAIAFAGAGVGAVAGLLTIAAPAAEPPKESVPLIHAHAHNDYEHTRPLRDALEHGFCSVEADVHLVDGQLLVAHDRAAVKPERTLEALYLNPLRERAGTNGGRVYRRGPTLILLIDVKSAAEATYAVLRQKLEMYPDILTKFGRERTETNAVTVIISGNRARAVMAAETVRYAAFDGRLEDLESSDPRHFMPLVSDNWTKHFQWRGSGPMPEGERQKLKEIVIRAHRQGRRVRFWETRDEPALWAELLHAGVDLINTDDLKGLEEFLLKQPR